jgi:heme exporter protein A
MPEFALIDINNLSCQRSAYNLFKPVSFQLEPSSSILISGPNGIGKTTLLESISGLRAFHEGAFNYQGQKIQQNKDAWYNDSFFIGHKVGHKKELNCLENLCSYLTIQGHRINTEKAEKALEIVGLAGYEYQLAGSLSAGQYKRLALARLKLIPQKIWILDEPFVNLDHSGCDWLLKTLIKHLNNKGCLIITAHDNQEIANIVSQQLILEPVL